jgi:hypothetical protein
MTTGHDIALLRHCVMLLGGAHAEEARNLAEVAARLEDDMKLSQEASWTPTPPTPPQGGYTCPLCQAPSTGSLHWHKTVQVTASNGELLTVRCPVAEIQNVVS